MPDNKIRISLEEVQSPHVDAQLKYQEALNRVREHHANEANSIGASSAPANAELFPSATSHAFPTSSSNSIWYNTSFYMAVFGLIGGFLGALAGELAQARIPTTLLAFQQAQALLAKLDLDVKNGSVSQEQSNIIQNQVSEALKFNPYFQIVMDNTIPDKDANARIEKMASAETYKTHVLNFTWFCLLGLFLSVALAIAEPVLNRNVRETMRTSCVATVLGLAAGAVCGLCLDPIYQALGGGLSTSTMATQVMARALGWSLLGLFICLAPGIVMWNLKKLGIGLAGGFLGGLLGGLFFDAISMVTHVAWLSRVLGTMAIGGFAGLFTGFIENVAKTGWIKVTAGMIAGKQFILYRPATAIGSSPQCEIYLFKDPQIHPKHAMLHQTQGGIDLEDLQSSSGTFVNGQRVNRVRLRAGDQVQIGSTCFVYQERVKNA